MIVLSQMTQKTQKIFTCSLKIITNYLHDKHKMPENKTLSTFLRPNRLEDHSI